MTDAGPSARTRFLIVAAILLLGLGLRLAGDFHDLRFSYHGDELHFIKRSMAMGTGDLNPHWFHKPAFLMYLLLFCYGVYYLCGALFGAFGSVQEFGAYFLNEPGDFVLIGRLVVTAFGTATIYVVYRLARRALKDFRAAACAALAAALLFPMAAASQSVKADVPASFFVALSFLWFWRAREEGRLRPLGVAALLAGVAMGTKYYGILLLPAFAAVELTDPLRRRRAWRAALGRTGLVVLLFTAGFFVTSPFNFLDPTWGNTQLTQLKAATGLSEPISIYDADNDTRYETGPGTIGGASIHLAGQIIGLRAFGVLTLLFVLGLAAALRDRIRRAYAAYVLLAIGGFWLMATTLHAYHISWRHLNAIAPFACTLLYPGALLLAGAVRRGKATATLVLLVALLPTTIELVRHDAVLAREDSRTVAYDWIMKHTRPAERILLDEYGTILKPNAAALARQEQRLEGLPEDEAFTRHQRRRLELLAKYPSREGRNFDALAHPWWSDRELTDEELRGSWRHRDMGNPLKLRRPRTLDEYRADGYRWVVTNSQAQERYLASSRSEQAFPSFVRFYRELKRLEPTRTFDPDAWNGKGPIVWVYDLAAER